MDERQTEAVLRFASECGRRLRRSAARTSRREMEQAIRAYAAARAIAYGEPRVLSPALLHRAVEQCIVAAAGRRAQAAA